MSELPYNENDGFVGFWINDEPYYVISENYLTSDRTHPKYNTSHIVKKGCNDPLVFSYFQYLPEG